MVAQNSNSNSSHGGPGTAQRGPWRGAAVEEVEAARRKERAEAAATAAQEHRDEKLAAARNKRLASSKNAEVRGGSGAVQRLQLCGRVWDGCGEVPRFSRMQDTAFELVQPRLFPGLPSSLPASLLCASTRLLAAPFLPLRTR